MYSSILIFHNVLRWIVLLFCLIAVLGSLFKWIASKSWTRGDRLIGASFVIAVDIQFVLGLLLFGFLSPLTRAAFANFGVAMQNKEMRFFALEHSLLMICFLALVHFGNVRIKRTMDDRGKHRAGLIWWGISLLILLAGIPWWRPLLRIAL
jgi:hypothetical protein